MEFAEKLLNPLVAGYLVAVILIQCILRLSRRLHAAKLEERRERAGLSGPVLIDHSIRLAEFRRSAWVEAVVLGLAIIVLPFLVVVAEIGAAEWREGLALTFVGLFLWLLLSATDVGKAFLGGLTFRLCASLKPPFQVGDRVTIKGHSGRVTDIGTFYVRLQTPDDEQVCVPTGDLWKESLVTTNAGARSSLCVMKFYLPPSAGGTMRRVAENAIWDAIQASSYFDPAHPIKIFSEQTFEAVELTAKAHVANTFKEAEFKSEVTTQVLEVLRRESVPL